MMRKGTLQGAAFLVMVASSVVVASGPSSAEVQNVKVSGDVTVRGIFQENLDLRAEDGTFDQTNYFMTTTGLNVGVDFTENISAMVRLLNERDWNQDSAASSDVSLSQAYISLQELFYAPLTLRIGTQPIKWGRGFVLGSNLLPSVLSQTASGVATGIPGAGDDRHAAINANQFTDLTSFDAIRASLNLGETAGLPLNVDYVYIKLDENAVGNDDDVNLQGINLGTSLETASAELETYFLNKRDKSSTNAANRGSVSTWGVRGSAKPMDGASVYAEVALQFGNRATLLDGATLATGSGQKAWAANLGADYTFADVATTPKVGGEWIYYSGSNVDGAFQGWDPIAPSYFPTLIRSFQTRSTVTGLYPVDQTGVTSGFTNQHELALSLGLKPLEDLSADWRLSWFFLDTPAIPPTSPAAGAKRESFVGTEWDTIVNYDYTEDVQLGISYGLFLPGSVFRDAGGTLGAGRSTAQQFISTVKVQF